MYLKLSSSVSSFSPRNSSCRSSSSPCAAIWWRDRLTAEKSSSHMMSWSKLVQVMACCLYWGFFQQGFGLSSWSCFYHIKIAPPPKKNALTQHGLVTPYGDINLGEHALWQQALTSTSVVVSTSSDTFIWGQFHKRYLSHQSLKLAWKLLI